MITLNTHARDLRMVGLVFAARLKKLGLETVSDLLYHIPHRYEDFSLKSKIASLQLGSKVSIVGQIKKIANVFTKYGKKIQKATLSDETGEVEIVWYNQPFLLNVLKIGMTVSIAGEVKNFGRKLIFASPDFEIIKPTHKLLHTGRLVPIYPETEGVSSKWLRSRLNTILNILNIHIPEYLPSFIREKYNLCPLNEAINRLHFPNNYGEVQSAKRRLSFDEMFLFQLRAGLKKREWQLVRVIFTLDVGRYRQKIMEFIKNLPFELTTDQVGAVNDILNDLKSDKPMNRLLEGDVGSGKTVVATVAMYLTYLSNFQSILMAPTEILAMQHYETVQQLLKPYGVKIALVSSSQKPLNQNYDIFIGTHALLFDKATFEKVALVVIDEQQRFGVAQRSLLRKKAGIPHLLTMTATPIPRTIALTLYSDLALSVLNTLPRGRIKPKTWVVPVEKREKAYLWIKNEIKNNNSQAFIVCPLIDISDSLEAVKSAKDEYEKLKKDVFADLKLGLLHGRLKAKDKNKVLKDFSQHKLDILVTTPVVEVGIDIPDAAIIMIEGSERFGLSQLHQLRGRVGRRNQQAYCLLFTESSSQKTLARLQLLTTIYNGPHLAEEDLKLRGAGEIFGTRQHGLGDFKVADITDLVTISETKEAAELILNNDQTLKNFPLLREKLEMDKIKSIAPD